MRTSIITAVLIALMAIPGTAHNSGVDYCKNNARACLNSLAFDTVEQPKQNIRQNAHDINPNNFQNATDPSAL